MQFLKQYTVCIGISMICAVIMSLFEPSGSMKRFYKILISVFVFISFIYPLKDVSLKSTKSILDNIEEQQYLQNENTYKNMVNSEIKTVLNEEGISGANVSSDLKINRENEIEINSVLISVPAEYDKTNVKELVMNKLGIDARVIHTGE